MDLRETCQWQELQCNNHLFLARRWWSGLGCSCSLSWRLTMKSSWGWGRWYLWISKSHEPTHHHQACLIASTTTQELEALPPWLDDVMMVPNLRIWIWHPKFEPKPSQGRKPWALTYRQENVQVKTSEVCWLVSCWSNLRAPARHPMNYIELHVGIPHGLPITNNPQVQRPFQHLCPRLSLAASVRRTKLACVSGVEASVPKLSMTRTEASAAEENGEEFSPMGEEKDLCRLAMCKVQTWHNSASECLDSLRVSTTPARAMC